MMKHVAAMQITTVIPWLSVKSNRSKYNMQLWPLDTYHYIVQDRLMGLQREWVQHRNKIIPRERFTKELGVTPWIDEINFSSIQCLQPVEQFSTSHWPA